MKQLVISLFLFLSILSLRAEKIAKGYIITSEKDTIYGSIDLQKFKGKLLTFYKPFNLGMFALSLTFTDQNGQDTEYPAGSIAGFDFEFENVSYKFRSLKIDSEELHSFASDDAPTHVFAQLEVEGEFLSFYVFRFNPDLFRKYKGRGSYFNYYRNEYVKTPSGLKFINRTYKKNELATIARNDLGLEEEFIKTIPKDYTYSDLGKLINDYNTFKKVSKN